MAVKTIASLVDGRVVPWFSEGDPLPARFVVVPEKLLAKFRSGEIKDGIALAKAALADNGELGTAPQNVAPPPPPPKIADADPGAVDPETIDKGEPTSPEVTHLNTRKSNKV